MASFALVVNGGERSVDPCQHLQVLQLPSIISARSLTFSPQVNAPIHGTFLPRCLTLFVGMGSYRRVSLAANQNCAVIMADLDVLAAPDAV